VALSLIHRSPSQKPLPRHAALWRTCLRDVVFLDGAATPVTDASETLVRDADAYALLVEIVSGLRSPIVGETEVQSQFKAFLDSLDATEHGAVKRLGQRVLADAKTVRHEHLQGVGAHSYGHLAAQHVPTGSRVAVIGTGALAAEVLVALGHDRVIDQWGRHAPEPRGERFRFFGDAVRADARVEVPTAVIVAAPVDAASLDAVLACYPSLVAIVDLRASGERTPLPPAPGAITVTLQDLFDAAPPACAAAATRLQAARGDIARLARAYERREELRPFGWDDLCA
jgi:glutamyl-tRNA reductase